ncbi:MAG TPA: hypothetical protein DCW90_09900, partial [Lachnospiraceae bacterium]|nr:hypothetical protein [Lachnospiraceae bacterium]
YPHHVVRNGNLVIHIGGLKAAFARASQQGIVSGKIKAHLLRHYHELGLSTENFAEFGITEEEFNMYFKEESCGDNKMKNFAIEGREAWGKIIEKIQAHEGKDVYVDSIEKDHIIYTKDDVRYRVDAEIKVGEDDDTIDAEIDWNTVRKDEDQKMSADEKLSVLEKKFADLKIECDKLENANKAYMAQIEAMSDYDKLKQFKLDTEAKEKEEKRMNAMCEIFSELSEKGFAMNDKQKDELTKKFAEFDSIDGFRNYAKAFAFDSLKEDSDKLHKMAYPDNNIHIDDIWDEIRAKGLID